MLASAGIGKLFLLRDRLFVSCADRSCLSERLARGTLRRHHKEGKGVVESSLNIAQLGAACGQCPFRRVCYSSQEQADFELMARLRTLIKRHKPKDRGAYLYRQGYDAKSIFIIRTGSAKAIAIEESGRQNTLSFLLPGNLAGTNSFYSDAYSDSVIMVERGVACEIPTDALINEFVRVPMVIEAVLAAFVQEITISQAARSRLMYRNADQRLADFICEYSDRLQHAGFSARSLKMKMPRYDIANYLGMAAGTLSRALRNLNDAGLITFSRYNIEIIDHNAIRIIADRDAMLTMKTA
jgi:CRP/FNR family transcriptional regulator